MTFENPTDGSAWPTSVPFGWSVEWDPSLAGSDPPEDAMLRAKCGVNLRNMCSHVLNFLPL
jgi:hypothetical protein